MVILVVNAARNVQEIPMDYSGLPVVLFHVSSRGRSSFQTCLCRAAMAMCTKTNKNASDCSHLIQLQSHPALR